MKPRAVAVLLIAALTVVALVLYFRPKPTPIPAREKTTMDSLAATKPAFTATVETLTVRESVYVQRAAEKAAVTRVILHTADSLRRVAIVAEASAREARDTSSRWFRVAMLNRAEADTLRVALDSATARGDHLDSALVAVREAKNIINARLLTVEDLSNRLAADLQRADPPCRVAFVARCPSRKTSALIGAGLAVGAVLYGKQLVSLIKL